MYKDSAKIKKNKRNEKSLNRDCNRQVMHLKLLLHIYRFICACAFKYVYTHVCVYVCMFVCNICIYSCNFARAILMNFSHSLHSMGAHRQRRVASSTFHYPHTCRRHTHTHTHEHALSYRASFNFRFCRVFVTARNICKIMSDCNSRCCLTLLYPVNTKSRPLSLFKY